MLEDENYSSTPELIHVQLLEYYIVFKFNNITSCRISAILNFTQHTQYASVVRIVLFERQKAHHSFNYG